MNFDRIPRRSPDPPARRLIGSRSADHALRRLRRRAPPPSAISATRSPSIPPPRSDRLIKVMMSFDVGSTGPVLLSLPAWTPGAYEISNFARWVVNFSPVSAGQPIRWDKLDYDTWRLQPAGSRSLSVRFDYIAERSTMPWPGPGRISLSSTALICCCIPRGPASISRPRLRSRPSPTGLWPRP